MYFDKTNLPPQLPWVETDFPFPLALTYRRVWEEIAADQPIPAALQLKDAFEAFLKFVACTSIADCLAADPPRKVAEEVAEALFRPISDGTWFDLFKKVTNLLAHDPAHAARRLLPKLAGLGDETEVGAVFTTSNTRIGFVTWRNKEFGHGAFRKDRDFYAAQVAEWLPKLNLCLEQLRPVLSGWRLVGDPPGGGDAIDWTGDRHLAHVEYHEHKPWGTPVSLALCGPDGRILRYGPLLSMQTCGHPACRQPAAFFFEGNEYKEKQDKHKTHFLEYFVGHSQTADNWPPVRELAARLPERFAFDRTSYNPSRLGEQVRHLFRDAEAEYERPAYLLDAFWEARKARPTGYYLWEGEQGVGKSFLAHGLECDAASRGVTVLRYHVVRGSGSQYQTFVSELAQEVRKKLSEVTQEIQTLVARQTDLAEQFRTFVAEVMRANAKKSLVIAIDGLDELREPDSPTGAVITDFLPPADKLPPGCTVVLTTRPQVCPRVRGHLDALAFGTRLNAVRVVIDPTADANRHVLREFIARHGPPVVRAAGAADEVMTKAGGVFLYVVHFCRALASEAYSGVADLPPAARFYPDYLGRIRDRVGDKVYTDVYERVLMLLTAAHEPVTRQQLHRWGVPKDRLDFALCDVTDFLRELRHRDFHDGISDDPEPRYKIAHEAFKEYAKGFATGPLKAAHRTIATVALRHNETKWEGLDPADDADLYDVRFVHWHCDKAGMKEEAEGLRRSLQHANAVWDFANFSLKADRSRLAVEIFTKSGQLYSAIAATTGDESIRLKWFQALRYSGTAMFKLGELSDALSCFHRLLDMVGSPMDDSMRVERAKLFMNTAAAYTSLDRSFQSIAYHREAVSEYRFLVTNRGRRDLTDDFVGSLRNLGSALAALEQSSEASNIFDEAVSEARKQSGSVANGVLTGALLAQAHFLVNIGQPTLGIVGVEEAIRIESELIKQGKLNSIPRLHAAIRTKALAFYSLNRAAEAVTLYNDLVCYFRELVDVHGRIEFSEALANTLNLLGVTHFSLNQFQEASVAHDEASRILRSLVALKFDYRILDDLALSLMSKGSALQCMESLVDSVECYTEVIHILRAALDRPESLEWAGNMTNTLASALVNDGNSLVQLGRHDEAVLCIDEGIDLFGRLLQNPQSQILPNLLQALRIRFDLAVAHENWSVAVIVLVRALQAYVPKQQTAEIIPPEQVQFQNLLLSMALLSVEQREQLLAVSPPELAEFLRTNIFTHPPPP